MIRVALILVAVWATCGAASFLLVAANKAHLERHALECARTSDGSDQDIADCYTSRGLRVPSDI